MTTKLVLAAITATLAVAPMAMAQTYQNDASQAPAASSSSSSGRTDSPAVESLPGVKPDPWHAENQTGATPDRRATDDATTRAGMTHKRAMSGSTGGAVMGRDASGSSDRRVTGSKTWSNTTTGNTTTGGSTMTTGRADDLASRRGRGQNDLELSQTSLLNQFSAAGYTVVRDFRKDGDRYTAQAQDANGRWATVALDPRSGTISPR